MAYRISASITSIVLLFVTAPAAAQSQNAAEEQRQEQAAREILAMPWIARGEGSVGGVASIPAATDARVLAGDSVARFIQLTGNLPDPGATVVAPKDLHWFSLYDYSDVGYVTDKDNIDADALLKSLREEQDAANVRRQQQGLPQLTIVGWAVQPHYDSSTHNLEWGLKLNGSDGENVINYTARHLGRGGYVSSVLVSSPETFQKDLAEFRASDSKLAFDPGSTYAEFRNGDKVAGYGLAALIVGGAGAAVVKSGAAKGFIAAILIALKGFAKVIIAFFVALFAGVARFLSKLFRRGAIDDAQDETTADADLGNEAQPQ